MPIGSSQGITLPTQGGNTDTWGTDLNTELQKLINSVESQVPSSAVDYSATLDVNEQGVENIDYLEFLVGGGTGGGARSLYMNTSGNLVFVDGSNNTVVLTAGGTLNSASIGGIADSGGDYGTNDIEVDWNGTQYDFHDGANNYAPVRVGDLRLEDSAFYITLTAPSLSASYTLTLPSAAPSATTPLVMNSSGTVTAATELDVSGDVYRGEFELHLPLTITTQSGSDYVYTANGTTPASIVFNAGGGTGNYCLFDVPFIRTDDRVKGLEVDISNLATDASFRVQLFQGSTQIGSNGDNSGTLDQTISIGSPTARAAAGDGLYWIKFDKILAGAQTVTIDKIRLTLDRTKP